MRKSKVPSSGSMGPTIYDWKDPAGPMVDHLRMFAREHSGFSVYPR